MSKTEQPSNQSGKTHTAKKDDSFSIFIADDNEINRLLLKSQLETHYKNITLAKEGKTAQSYLRQQQYDLIFLDLQMPYFSGLELIKTIKQPGSINKDSPVIAITAHVQKHKRRALIDAGFDECLIKPVLMEQLKEILELWLPEAHSHFDNDPGFISYVSAMLEKTLGNQELAKALFNKLFIELPEQSQIIENAIESKDWDRAKEITHKLHGSVIFCGFTDIQAIAKNLELSLSKNSTQLINKNFLELKNKINDFIRLQESIFKQINTLRT